jgi:hypothetical protein
MLLLLAFARARRRSEILRENTVVKVANGARKVTHGSEHCFYNFQVVGLE